MTAIIIFSICIFIGITIRRIFQKRRKDNRRKQFYKEHLRYRAQSDKKRELDESL